MVSLCVFVEHVCVVGMPGFWTVTGPGCVERVAWLASQVDGDAAAGLRACRGRYPRILPEKWDSLSDWRRI